MEEQEWPAQAENIHPGQAARVTEWVGAKRFAYAWLALPTRHDIAPELVQDVIIDGVPPARTVAVIGGGCVKMLCKLEGDEEFDVADQLHKQTNKFKPVFKAVRGRGLLIKIKKEIT